MEEQREENDLSKWFSTYGLITAERILGTFHIVLQQDELLMAIKSPFSFYNRILQIPLKNVLTGIVLQQANDYHVYVQKLFIDYLLSGESGKDEASQGASVRENIEEERNALVTLGEEYHKTKLEHDTLIATSQRALIMLTQNWTKALEVAIKRFETSFMRAGLENTKNMKQAINHGVVHCDLSENGPESFVDKINEILNVSLSSDLKVELREHLSELVGISNSFDSEMNSFFEKTKEMNGLANSYRTEFYNTILRVTELIKLLPDYKINPQQDQVNREMLYFDKSIGDTSA